MAANVAASNTTVAFHGHTMQVPVLKDKETNRSVFVSLLILSDFPSLSVALSPLLSSEAVNIIALYCLLKKRLSSFLKEPDTVVVSKQR